MRPKVDAAQRTESSISASRLPTPRAYPTSARAPEFSSARVCRAATERAAATLWRKAAVSAQIARGTTVRDLLNGVILLGAVQGAALAAALVARRKNRVANRIL